MSQTEQANLRDYYTKIQSKSGIFYGVNLDSFNQEKRQAKQLAQDVGELRGSIEDGDGNYAGFLAELVLAKILNADRDATYDYDLFIDLYGGLEVDVKTKRRTVPPKSYYEVSIADWNTSQDCDWYYFVSFDEDSGVLWFLGYMEPDDYYEVATFHEEGEKDPDNGFTFKADCYNVAFSKLKQPKKIADELGEVSERVQT